MKNRDPDENGWQSSASAWIARTGDKGDWSREFVLDQLMLERAKESGAKTALDIGCGEGRFCRALGKVGIDATGVDPVPEMVAEAKKRHALGHYIEAYAEQLPFADQSFDLIISYLSLIDIDDADVAISEMSRVLKPGGRILVANLSSFATSAGTDDRCINAETGEEVRLLGAYLHSRKDWFEWGGLRIQNWHRPLSSYIKWFLGCGLQLTHFDEPEPVGGPEDRSVAYQKMPYLMMMEWQKPPE